MNKLFSVTSDLDPIDALAGHEELLDAIGSANERPTGSVAFTHVERDRAESVKALTEHRRIPDRE